MRSNEVNQQALWVPSPERCQATHMAKFRRMVRLAHPDLSLADSGALHAWSIAHPDAFWAAVWRYCDVRAVQPWKHVLQLGEHMTQTRWFVGSTLNFAENLLRYQDQHIALIAHNEQGQRRCYTYQALYAQVERVASGLKVAGVVSGDRVAGYLPNIPEAVIAMLATTSLGAIWSSCSPDFGLQGALARFSQIQPKVLFTTNACQYGGHKIALQTRVLALVAQLPDLKQVIIVPFHPGDRVPPPLLTWDAWLAATQTVPLTFTPVPFDHPLYILYSSGTTGMPKCIVHGVGGTLLQHLKELMLHTDLHRDEVIFYYTTCGWMMWNWLVSSLAVGATLVLYDGNPFYPSPSALMDLAEQENIQVFGVSAKYLSALQKAGVKPRASHALGSLRTILSTGSPLAPNSFDYVYEHIKADVQLSSISGGTDIVSCFALGDPTRPVYRGELQCKGLGMAVEVFHDELVCTQAFPSMPIGFWRDDNDEKYHQAYFNRYDNVWAQGDFAEITAHDGLIIHGRSDAVLNPGGVRIGTAEIYRPVESLPEVFESIVVSQDWADDVRIVLFVKLTDGIALTEKLVQKIKHAIREQASPRHVPAVILAVTDIPRTLSGKIAELAVRQVIHHQPVHNLTALANPEALAQYRGRIS